MSLYHMGACGHSVEFGSNCQQCEWNETQKTIEDLKAKLADVEKTNFILHTDRNEVFKLWDMHKYRLEIAKEALAFYANKHNYEDHDFKGGMGHTMTFKPILDDGFDIAIKALERINEE